MRKLESKIDLRQQCLEDLVHPAQLAGAEYADATGPELRRMAQVHDRLLCRVYSVHCWAPKNFSRTDDIQFQQDITNILNKLDEPRSPER